MMVHVKRNYFENIQVRNLVVTRNGKSVFALDKGKLYGNHAIYDFNLSDYDPADNYVLKAEIKPGRGKTVTFEVCIRKETPCKKQIPSNQ